MEKKKDLQLLNSKQLKGTFGEYYDYHYRDIATHEVDDLNMEDPITFLFCKIFLPGKRRRLFQAAF